MSNYLHGAYGQIQTAGTKVAASEIDTLAEYLGNIDPQILLANWDQVGPMLSSALAEGEDAFHRLNEAAFISITGTSVADFSALTSGLISVQNLAADAVDALIATGQWTMETITMPQEGAQWNPLTGVWTRTPYFEITSPVTGSSVRAGISLRMKPFMVRKRAITSPME